MLYRKKPVVVEAVKWNGENDEEVKAFCGSLGNPVIRQARGKLVRCFDIYTLEGWVYASPGDYIIRGVHGEFYPCKPDIFEETYESVEAEDDI